MRFVSVRELCTKPKEVWQKIKEDDIIITSNGKPMGYPEKLIESTIFRKINHPYSDNLPEPSPVKCYRWRKYLQRKSGQWERGVKSSSA